MYDEKQLARFREALGRSIKSGIVIELVGDVGAGKTTLTKAIARGLGITDPMQSPSFTIVNRYVASSGLELAHYDFYRLHDPGIMSEELAETVNDKNIVTVIEWANVVSDVLPNERLQIRLNTVDETHRQMVFDPRGKAATDLLEGLEYVFTA
jgi:tRNA threonylcarbamoyladenosine biosynthesis protein TsaE